ncbi:MAG TPA: hypothetical protein VFD13_00305 [Candidatus Kapabacteria bacterium]|nr:hypothetical protein [Candidatus Kapabacteria bacterium]
MKSNNKDRIFLHDRPWGGRVLSALVLAALAALTIVFSSPLFAVLGFEYSALMALALSFVCGIAAIQRQGTKETQSTKILSVAIESILLAFVPLVISVLSLIPFPNCSFWDGLFFYLEIALPSAIFGGLFGLAFERMVKSRAKAILLFIGFWVVTLILSLLPGYTNPQLFAYGWQYGFFPGFVWDEAMELNNAYLAARLEQLVWVAVLLSFAKLITVSPNGTHRTDWTHRTPLSIIGLFLISAIVLFTLHDQFGITTSHAAVQALLSQQAQPAPNCTIYYAPGSLTNDELDKFEEDVRWYLHDIEGRFQLSPKHPPIRIYIYPSNDAMFKMIGTRIASIAKPWFGEVEIAKGNLQNLKHELTHVMLREKGVFPFYASWSTEITEGAAMSVEPEYDGIYTLDEHAARILQLHYLTGVTQIMSFTGFAANASEKSYVLAGSFSRYLLRAYGPAPFDRVYASLDWQKEYGKSLDLLETEWKRWLAPLMTPMDAGDSAHFRYYYDRTSIIFNPCLRRIGKLDRNAADAYRDHRLEDAKQLYTSALEEGGGIGSLTGLSDALLELHQLGAALNVLDTTRTPVIQKQRIVLANRQADLRAVAGDTLAADSLYSTALAAKLSSGTFLVAYVHRVLLHSAVQREWIERLREEYMPDTDRSKEFESFLRVWRDHIPQPGFDRTDLALRYVYSVLLEGKGELIGASQTDPFGERAGTLTDLAVATLSENDSLAIALMALHFAKLQSENLHCNYDLSFATNFCPPKYSRAIGEELRELDAEWKFRNAEPPAPETSP